MTTAAAKQDIDTWRRMKRMLSAERRLDIGSVPVHRRQLLSDLVPRRGQEEAFRLLADYVKWFPDFWRRGTGMTLVGPSGMGKTTLACALATTLVRERGYIAAYSTLGGYIRMEQRLIGRQKLTDGRDALAQEAREEIAEITEAEWILRRGAYLVILDDVGKEHRTASGWAAQEFELLLRERYDSGLPTIITTNLSFDKWDAEYSQNLRSFATEACPAVEFGG